MEHPESATLTGTADVQIPLDLVAKFVRQLSHDERNNLGSIDLQAAYLAEIVTDPEIAGELKKLRGMVASAAKMLQGVSAHFWVAKPNLVALDAGIFLEDFRERLRKVFPEAATQVVWTVELHGEEIAVDLELIFTALSEVCRNAFHFQETTQPISIRVAVEGGEWIFEVREKRGAVDAPTASWGLTPLVSTRRGGYGLGLFHVRQILARHGGDVEFRHEPASAVLTTRVALPLATGTENGR